MNLIIILKQFLLTDHLKNYEIITKDDLNNKNYNIIENNVYIKDSNNNKEIKKYYY